MANNNDIEKIDTAENPEKNTAKPKVPGNFLLALSTIQTREMARDSKQSVAMPWSTHLLRQALSDESQRSVSGIMP